jgi:hypothetical protein
MTEINDYLRSLLRAARRDPGRWKGRPRGLSQPELAGRIPGVTAIWLRQIETGTGSGTSADADTLGRICYELEIDSDLLRGIGYPDVAAAVDAYVMLKENAIPDHLLDNPPSRSAEEYLKGTPGMTAKKRKLLIEAFRQIERLPA